MFIHYLVQCNVWGWDDISLIPVGIPLTFGSKRLWRKPCRAILLRPFVATWAPLVFSVCVFWMPRLLGDFRGIPAGLSLRLFVLGTRSVWVLFLFLSPRAWVLMETRIPGGPHIKTRGIAALSFQTNITHFLCCLRDRGAWRFISRGSPPPTPPLTHYRLPAAHCPIPQQPLKANVSQGEGVAFLQEVN